eukprot:TRINITY_DN17376_c0_g1_i1.p1 TRINITY_DN17376_c0_g1~~TRINITY_DN17376_c0_g1_i1.p1  ORF type:complete len:138 (+),score=0.89 TRINITY_DN17376_c0_g1_i1:223-636(+)
MIEVLVIGTVALVAFNIYAKKRPSPSPDPDPDPDPLPGPDPLPIIPTPDPGPDPWHNVDPWHVPTGSITYDADMPGHDIEGATSPWGTTEAQAVDTCARLPGCVGFVMGTFGDKVYYKSSWGVLTPNQRYLAYQRTS